MSIEAVGVATCQLRVFSSNNIPEYVLITQEYTWPTKLLPSAGRSSKEDP